METTPGVRLIFPALLLLAAARLGAEPAAAPPIQIDQAQVDHAVLFAFDDYSVPFTKNLVLSMEAPVKYPGNPVIPIGRPGEPDEWQVRYYGTVIHHGGKFMMWYIALSREDFTASGVINETGSRIAYAESPDGIHWTKPHLGLSDFRGSKDNNLVGMPAGFRGYHALVLFQPGEPDPTRRFKMMMRTMHFGPYRVDPEAKLSGAYVPLYSADGLSWRIADELTAGDKMAISPRFHLVTHFEGSGLYDWQGMYYLSGQSTGFHELAATSPYGRHIQIFRSPDLLHWSETQTMGYARQGQYRPVARRGEPINLEQTHEGASVWVRGNVMIGITGFWHGSDDWATITHDLGFLVSNDGLHFREPQPDFIFARVGEMHRDWDYGGLAQGDGFENVGDKTLFWYGAPMYQAEGIRTGRPFLREGGIGLLTLDRDRFGFLSVRDPDADGIFITSAITAGRPVRLWVNAEGVGPDSPLRVELLDYDERPLPGYSGGQAVVLRHSGPHEALGWSGGPAIDAGGKPFKIQVRLEGYERNAIRVYALYLGP